MHLKHEVLRSSVRHNIHVPAVDMRAMLLQSRNLQRPHPIPCSAHKHCQTAEREHLPLRINNTILVQLLTK
jgi:hypothetical protein